MDDIDGDGIVNILEHAYGTSDMNGTEGNGLVGVSVEPLTIDNVMDDYLVVSFQRKVTADDVVVVAQLGSDLVGWSSEETEVIFVSQINSADGLSTVTYRSADPVTVTSIGQMFFRLAVSPR